MHAVDNTQQLFLAIIYLKKFVLAVVVALPSYMLKVPIVTYQRPRPMFLLYRLNLGPPLGLGAPGFSRSEPIVVTPLNTACMKTRVGYNII
jgi:hypothetical protein